MTAISVVHFTGTLQDATAEVIFQDAVDGFVYWKASALNPGDGEGENEFTVRAANSQSVTGGSATFSIGDVSSSLYFYAFTEQAGPVTGPLFSTTIAITSEVAEVRTIYDREYQSRPKRYSQNVDEGIQYKIDYSRVMTDRDETIVSVTWEAKNGIAIISNTSLASNIAAADIRTDQPGTALVKVTATQSDGNKRVKWLKIRSSDPNRFTCMDYCCG